MPKLNFMLRNNESVTVDADYNLSILQIAQQNNIGEIRGVCNGSAICGTCHIILDENDYKEVLKQNPIRESEEIILDTLPSVHQFSRLACQVTFTNILDKKTIKIFNG